MYLNINDTIVVTTQCNYAYKPYGDGKRRISTRMYRRHAALRPVSRPDTSIDRTSIRTVHLNTF